MQTTATPKIPNHFPAGTSDLYNIINHLWERTADKLNDEELQWFTMATEPAQNLVQRLQQVLEGIAYLVESDDRRGERYAECGSFQNPSDASALLFFAAQSVESVRSLLMVATAAQARLDRTRALAIVD
jgi:hypothetical protein